MVEDLWRCPGKNMNLYFVSRMSLEEHRASMHAKFHICRRGMGGKVILKNSKENGRYTNSNRNVILKREKGRQNKKWRKEQRTLAIRRTH